MLYMDHYESKKRDMPVPFADNGMLIRGTVLLALGGLLASLATCHIGHNIRTGALAAGILCAGISLRFFLRYWKQDRAYHQYVPKWEPDRGIYDRFGQELNAWYSYGKVPVCCDADMAYALTLQQERLAHNGLVMHSEQMPSRGDSFGTVRITQTSPWYSTDMMYEEISRRIRFDRHETTVYERRWDQTMYAMVVHSPDEERTKELEMTCPNCGAVSPVARLEQGCPYCGTRYQIKDLFPRVVNQFFLWKGSVAQNRELTRRIIWGSILTVFVMLMLANAVGMIFWPEQSRILPLIVLTAYGGALLAGGMGGVMLSAIVLVVTNFSRDGVRGVPWIRCAWAPRRLKRELSGIDPWFSCQKFEGRVIALIRMAVFAQKPENLAVYQAGERDAGFASILEMTYADAMAVKGVRRSGNMFYLTLQTWWVNYVQQGERIKKRGDCIEVTLARDISGQEKPGFSITSVSCPGCGGSFDAVRQRYCPFCRLEYPMQKYNWVIREMKFYRKLT